MKTVTEEDLLRLSQEELIPNVSYTSRNYRKMLHKKMLTKICSRTHFHSPLFYSDIIYKVKANSITIELPI